MKITIIEQYLDGQWVELVQGPFMDEKEIGTSVGYAVNAKPMYGRSGDTKDNKTPFGFATDVTLGPIRFRTKQEDN